MKVSILPSKYYKWNNWIDRIGKTPSGVESIIEKRQIQYYSLNEIDEIMMLETNQNACFANLMGDFWGGVKERFALLSYDHPSSTALWVIVLSLTVLGIICLICTVFKPPFFRRRILANDMRRMWMYDSSIYLNVLSFFGIVLGCFVASVLLLALVGGIAWLIAWVIKILFWIIIWLGIIATVVGVIAAFARSEIAALLIVGIPILIFKNTLERWGESIVSASFSFLQHVNLIGWTFGLVTNLWDVILFAVFFPVGAFLLVAFSIIVFNTLLKSTDYIFTRIYSIKQPCPCCGSTKTPDYIVGGKVHPLKLQPGMFGIFHQISPVTKQPIPTMLLNGKGKLIRKCPECSAIVNPDSTFSYGTEIHIGIVGPRSSGKSYFLYSGLSRLMNTYQKNIRQVDLTQDTKISEKEKRILNGQGIQTSNANQYRAIQIMVIPPKKRPVPYHVFFYDVAGEKFDAHASNSATAMSFYQNVQSVVFVLDPSMIDFAGLQPNNNILQWVNSVNKGEAYNPQIALSVLMGLLETAGRKSQEIDFGFVLTKADLGYFEANNYVRAELTEDKIREFIIMSLGLSNLANSVENSFKSVHYFQVSVYDNEEDNLRKMFEDFIEKQADNYGIFSR